MRRTIFIVLTVIGVIALGVRFFVNERLTSESPPGLEIQLVEYNSFNELSTTSSPLAQMQVLLDRLSEAAINEQWSTAALVLQQLGDKWRALTPEGTNQLEAEREIEQNIEALQRNVWSQDEQAVLSTAQKLTVLLNQFTS